MAHLTKEARQVLAGFELLMHGKTASLGGSTRGDEDRNPVPQGESSPPHEHWRVIFLRCAEHDLHGLIMEAQQELALIRRRDPESAVVVDESRDAWEERLIEEGEGHEARDVALSFSTSVVVVTKLRRKYKRDPSLGYHLSDIPGETKRERVARMHQAGASTRQIAQFVGVHQTQVVRWSKSAAA